MPPEQDVRDRIVNPRDAGLVIRPSSPDDAEQLTALQNMPLARAGTLRLPHTRVAETRKFLENPMPGNIYLIAELDGLVVGNAGINRFPGRRAHACGLGICIHDDYQGRGIGTALMRELVDAADNWLDIRRIELTVFTDNAPAIRLYEKFGFVTEGTLRSYAYRNGRYEDAFTMARIRAAA